MIIMISYRHIIINVIFLTFDFTLINLQHILHILYIGDIYATEYEMARSKILDSTRIQSLPEIVCHNVY